MAKNIKLGNNTLTGITELKVQDATTSGVLDSFVDTTDANATAEDITQGKTAYVNGVKVTGSASGGSADLDALLQETF